MRRFSILFLIVFLFCLFNHFPAEAQEVNRKVIGYYTSWSIYARDYHVPDIPAEKITHINYAFANISNGEIALGDHYADVDRFYPGDSWEPGSLRGCFRRLQVLKEEYPHVKTLISVGGWTWSAQFSDLALTEDSRNTFAASCAAFIDLYDFDGVDIDWEYPVEGGLEGNIHRPEDRENFTLLMASLRTHLDSLGAENGREYLLTAAVSASPTRIENLEVDLLPQYLDWINIMTYDFHGPWGGDGDPCTNFHSALYPCEDDPTGEPFHSGYNFSAAVQNYIEAGFPAEGINAGLPFYGHGFGNVENVNNGLFANYSGGSSNGTWENSKYDYWDLEENYINTNGFTRYWHDEALVPWLYNPANGDMIVYDDSISIAHKCQYIMSQNLGGAMFWEFSGDRDEVLIDAVFNSFQAAQISFSTDILDFGDIELGEHLDLPLTISNLGGEDLTISEINISENVFSAELTTPIIISGHDSFEMLVRFQPVDTTDYSGQLTVISDDDNFPENIIQLAGNGWADTEVENSGSTLPLIHGLVKIYPNPFNPQTTAIVELAHSAELEINIYNTLGQHITTLINRQFSPGRKSFTWNAIDYPSGMYLLRVQIDDHIQVKKINLLK